MLLYIALLEIETCSFVEIWVVGAAVPRFAFASEKLAFLVKIVI